MGLGVLWIPLGGVGVGGGAGGVQDVGGCWGMLVGVGVVGGIGEY